MLNPAMLNVMPGAMKDAQKDDHHVAIIGAGFSGTLLAINLLRHEGPRATLIERRPAQAGRGVAYATAQDEHLLNVRAGNMSAFPDRPDHFLRWLDARGVAGQGGFVGRTVYGAYLSEALDAAMSAAPQRLRLIEGEAVAIDLSGHVLQITLGSGQAIAAQVAVLAQGNLPPHDPPAFAGLDPLLYRSDPWRSNVVDGLDSRDSVLLVGTGLTAIDVALSLDAADFEGQIVALSRRGMVPRAHGDGQKPPAAIDKPPQAGSRLVRHIRARAQAVGWRTAVDELRAHTQNLWRGASALEQRRFLRHLRPFWDVHRHRLAPPVAARIARMQADGRLRFVAGKVVQVTQTQSGADIIWRPRGTAGEARIQATRIVNCTGPQGDVTRSDDLLLRNLLAQGHIRPDTLHLGIDVDAGGHVIGRDGNVDDRLFALGPMTRGALWEIVAVPDLRQQSWTMARRLSAAHWVGGEGL